ncbi:hypothetical protein AB0O72_13850 [Streptomyces sp. NPDC088106]|uniref:hypothetical protein n=1 Tax=Streptomyces sp. NPDC088106 TaxID=3154867 RepID=UPI003448472E
MTLRRWRERPTSLTVTFESLELIFRRHVATLRQTGDWKAWLGVALALGLPLTTASYAYAGKKLFLEGSQWQAITGALTLLALFQTVRVAYANRRAPSIDDLMDEVAGEAGAVLERRAIFVIKRRGNDGAYRVLAYWQPAWDCFLLPNINLNEGISSSEAMIRGASTMIGTPEDRLTLSPYPEQTVLRSSKYSPTYRRETSYRFEFHHVAISGEISSTFAAESFSHGGFDYSWLTVAELRAHAATREKNGDVLKHLNEQKWTLLESPPDSYNSSSVTP